MGLLFADGFGYDETNDLLNWWDIRSDVFRENSQPNHVSPNDYYLRIIDNGALDGFYKFLAPQTVLTVGCAFMVDDLASRSLIHLWGDSTIDIHGSIMARYDSAVGKHYLTYEIWAGDTYSSNVYFDIDYWHYLEWQFKCDDTTGYSIVRLNGEEVISVYNIDTNRADNGVVNFLRVGGNSSINSNDNAYDDFYITTTGGGSNTGFLGPVTVESVYPGGTGFINDWIGSDGDSTDNHLLVDDASNTEDASYVESSGIGDTDLYKMSSLSQSAEEVKAVQIFYPHKRIGLNPASGVTLVAKDSTIISGVNYLAREGAYWKGNFVHYDIDPFTSLPWTHSGLDDLQIGNRVTHVS